MKRSLDKTFDKEYTHQGWTFGLEYLDDFASDSGEDFTGYSENDGEQYVLRRFSLNSLSLFSSTVQ